MGCADGLPVGLNVVGARCAEAALLGRCTVLERLGDGYQALSLTFNGAASS